MNIVFAFADDWGRYASAYAEYEGVDSINHLISTPNFDWIAKEGALFTNAFVPAPSCTPCRSSVLSGQYFWNTGLGAILLGAMWDKDIPSYPLELEKVGYHIGYTHKVWGPGKPGNAPYGGKRTSYQTGGIRFNNFSHEATKRVKEVGLQKAKQELLDETLINFDSFLNACPDNKPFCYWWGPTNTHRTWEQGSGKNLWGLNPDDLKGRMPDFLPDVPEVREDFCDYLGECQAVDAGLGVLIRRLEEIGELDNTLLVVSGDHGIPGMPRGKCNLYDIGCEVALTMRWPGHIKESQIIDDFVNIMDLAPTFMEAAGEPIPDSMEAKSLMPLLESGKNGQIEENRTFVITGRERHNPYARKGFLPYPQRAIRTKSYLYIINFEPDRWPIGDPRGFNDFKTDSNLFDVMKWHGFEAYPDMDGSPTKTWMIHNRSIIPYLFHLGFGKRPYEELYDLNMDKNYMNNVADLPKYADIKKGMNKKLMDILKKHTDPRVTETPCRYELPPYAGELQDFQK